MDRRDFMEEGGRDDPRTCGCHRRRNDVVLTTGIRYMGGGPGATFGASVQPVRAARAPRLALLSRTANLAQRPFTTVHNRMPWETSLVNKYSEFIAGRGQIPILSWFT